MTQAMQYTASNTTSKLYLFFALCQLSRVSGPSSELFVIKLCLELTPISQKILVCTDCLSILLALKKFWDRSQHLLVIRIIKNNHRKQNQRYTHISFLRISEHAVIRGYLCVDSAEK